MRYAAMDKNNVVEVERRVIGSMEVTIGYGSVAPSTWNPV